MKTLSDVQENMAGLYVELREGKIEFKVAVALTGMACQWLKAEQLKLARELFIRGTLPVLLPSPKRRQLKST